MSDGLDLARKPRRQRGMLIRPDAKMFSTAIVIEYAAPRGRPAPKTPRAASRRAPRPPPRPSRQCDPCGEQNARRRFPPPPLSTPSPRSYGAQRSPGASMKLTEIGPCAVKPRERAFRASRSLPDLRLQDASARDQIHRKQRKLDEIDGESSEASRFSRSRSKWTCCSTTTLKTPRRALPPSLNLACCDRAKTAWIVTGPRLTFVTQGHQGNPMRGSRESKRRPRTSDCPCDHVSAKRKRHGSMEPNRGADAYDSCDSDFACVLRGAGREARRRL